MSHQFNLKREKMTVEENKDYLDVKALILLFIITLVWGFNHPSIKYTNQGIAPVFASTLRSIIASMCGVVYCLWKKEKIFHTDIICCTELWSASSSVRNSPAYTLGCFIQTRLAPSFSFTRALSWWPWEPTFFLKGIV